MEFLELKVGTFFRARGCLLPAEVATPIVLPVETVEVFARLPQAKSNRKLQLLSRGRREG